MRAGSLRVIEAFVRLGGTAEASQALGVTQSALIKALRLAQAELNIDLVATVQGRLVPTPEARALHREARHVFDALVRARHEADMIRVGMAGRLRIAAAPSLAHSLLPDAITAMRRRSGSSISVEILFDWVAERLSTREVDVGLSYGPAAAAGIVDEVIRTGSLVCVVDGGHALAASRGVRAADLLGHRLVSYAPLEEAADDSFRRALVATGLDVSVAISVRHADIACHFARERIGIAVVDDFATSGELETDLTVVPVTDAPTIMAYAHVRAGASVDSPAMILLSLLRSPVA